ncbi:MAG: 4-phosphopantetheinyl transferase [Acidobacteriota bacterium]|jgi:4'-phosphopantetheinyl transferase|nr:4-phosphopantetheinyl transferase [Acidobacteriota bacterium]
MSLDTRWAAPPEQLTLLDDEVHVWRASLPRTTTKPPQLQSLYTLLSPDEVSRAERFHFERDRASFIVARGMLRTILAVYLKLHPAQLQFRYNAYGKPALDGDEASSGLRFNLAHSHELALYAVTRNREIGIDVEYIRADFAGDEIAERFFSSTEIATLRKLSLEQRTEAFFNCWTRKEAYIKARGEGLSFPLDRFDVSLIPGEEPLTLNVHQASSETARWTLQSLMPEDGYVAAMAVEGDGWNLRYWQG